MSEQNWHLMVIDLIKLMNQGTFTSYDVIIVSNPSNLQKIEETTNNAEFMKQYIYIYIYKSARSPPTIGHYRTFFLRY